MDGDKAEKQDDYLTRMSGIFRLFATICLTQPPPKGLFGNADVSDGENGETLTPLTHTHTHDFDFH